MRLTIWILTFLPLVQGSWDIRLVNGSHNCSGRLEIYHKGQWGTLCDVRIGLAQLVCRQLGCGYAASAPQASLFGEGTGPVWKPSVGCIPGKPHERCSIYPVQTTSCNHSEDAGIICSDIVNIRLANGQNNCSGRVEFYYKDQWEAVCGDYWNMHHARVVCRELGCGYAVAAPVGAHFGNRTGPYWLKGHRCSGKEQSLISCSIEELTTCQKDAGVICSELGFDIRLVNGSNSCSGRVELYFQGQRRRLCDDGWDNSTAHVVCKQLGCGYAVSPQAGALFGEGTDPSWLLGVSCRGTESSLERCLSRQNGIQECTDGSVVSVICSGAAIPVRLANGNNSCSGRVEFNSIGVWGAVCGEVWDMNEAEVVCRELGCGSAVSALKGSHFGQGQGHVWQYIMECTGRESSLERCDSHELEASSCNQKYIAGVVCSGDLTAISSSPFYTVRCVFITCYLLVMSIAVIIERVYSGIRKAEDLNPSQLSS
ncbi:deleted in malignant brain tumors 1 protein-like [Polyodon spathula]|uniref:deleted in malignant brain tumors 1 protein-like n=1 Tax=Polyodon spathula TaxID=7913 RepID=UPI001B7F2022|nr:deleted in malignant brain tumors 1 protein-like [Polyodon spathula]